jgi:hypothetical protein
MKMKPVNFEINFNYDELFNESLKNYVCKHILSLAVVQKLIVIPLAYRELNIDEKPRRSRIEEAKKAYVIQDKRAKLKEIFEINDKLEILNFFLG